jgi:hypothetical protein
LYEKNNGGNDGSSNELMAGALLFSVALSLATSSTPRHVEKEK